MKTLLHIAIDSPHYNSSGISRAFEDCGFDVTTFRWQQEKYSLGSEAMRRTAIAAASGIHPDLIFVHAQNRESFDVATMEALQSIAPTINYTFDVRKDISWYFEIANKISLTVFCCKEDVEKFRNKGIGNVMYLPSTCDFEIYRHTENKVLRIHTPEIVFVGNDTVGSNLDYELADQRRNMVSFLQESYGNRFMAFGHGQRGGMISDRSHEVEIYNSCKVAVTQNHFKRTGYCSDRDWRATACGALTLHQYFDGVMELFGPSSISWATFDDLRYMCDYFVNNEEQRQELAAAHRCYVVENHSWTRRVLDMLKMIERYKTKPRGDKNHLSLHSNL